MKITANFRTLTPAYGRDYKSAAAATAHFDSNHDFVLQPENRAICKGDFAPGVFVNIRYDKLRKVAVCKVA